MRQKTQASADVVAEFDDWQSPKRGEANPENQTNLVWSWLARTKAWPGAAHKAAGTGERRYPGWCFDRFGQSKTELADRSVIYIGGEHEDSYDPDFYIYNDVVILRPDGAMEFYGYPTAVFPPTDFHSATRVGDEIYILGGLGYPSDRDYSSTFVFRLCLSDLSIHRVQTDGPAPAWLCRHTAELDEACQKIVCSGGEVIHGPTGRGVENLTTWEFDLITYLWSPMETKPFHRWLLVREDENRNELWGIGLVAKASRIKRKDPVAERYRQRFAARGHTVDADLFNARFTPPFPHAPVTAPDPHSDNFRGHRFSVEGVVVGVFEAMHEVAVTVEGELPAHLVTALQRFGLETYSAIEGVPYKLIPL